MRSARPLCGSRHDLHLGHIVDSEDSRCWAQRLRVIYRHLRALERSPTAPQKYGLQCVCSKPVKTLLDRIGPEENVVNTNKSATKDDNEVLEAGE